MMALLMCVAGGALAAASVLFALGCLGFDDTEPGSPERRAAVRKFRYAAIALCAAAGAAILGALLAHSPAP